MSLDQDFHQLAADLFTEFEAVEARVLRRGAAYPSPEDRAAGIMVQASEENTVVRAFIGKRTVRREDGVIASEATVTANGELREGDKLTINGRFFTVGAVEENNPYGTTPITWVAVIK